MSMKNEDKCQPYITENQSVSAVMKSDPETLANPSQKHLQTLVIMPKNEALRVYSENMTKQPQCRG